MREEALVHRRQKTIRKSIIAAHALAALGLTAPFVSRQYQEETRPNQQTETANLTGAPCGTTEVLVPIPMETLRANSRVYDGHETILDSPTVRTDTRLLHLDVINGLVAARGTESERARARRVLAVGRRLADLGLPVTEFYVRDSLGAIDNARQRNRNTRIFKDTVIVISGAVTASPDNGESSFFPDEMEERLRAVDGVDRVLHFDPLFEQRRGCDWTSVEALTKIRSQALQAIETAPTRTTVWFMAHGAPEFLEMGWVGLDRGIANAQRVVIEAEHMARAFAARYRNPMLADMARKEADLVIFDNCLTYELATRAFRREIRRIEREENRSIPLPDFLTSGEQGQLSYRAQLANRLLPENPNQAPTYGTFYPEDDLIGHRERNSQVTIISRDEAGRPIQIV